jgi:hypothetical protein
MGYIQKAEAEKLKKSRQFLKLTTMKKISICLCFVFACICLTQAQSVENPVSSTKDYRITGGTNMYAYPATITIGGVNNAGSGGHLSLSAGDAATAYGPGGNVTISCGSGKTGGNISLIAPMGQIKIGTSSSSNFIVFYPTTFKMTVNGKIEAEEMEVKNIAANFLKTNSVNTDQLNLKVTNVADYVFNSNYKLRSLVEVEKFIKLNKHLPDVPAAADLEKNGMDVAKINNLLLQKVEELTLYVIELNKQLQEAKNDTAAFRSKQ